MGCLRHEAHLKYRTRSVSDLELFSALDRINPDYSRQHTHPKRKGGVGSELPSLALWVSMVCCAP